MLVKSTNDLNDDIWLKSWKSTPYWLEGLPVPDGLHATPATSADVVIIGSGYTGMNAAIETARGGRSTVVLDAGPVGQGCSTRNGGQISTSVKPSYAKLAAQFGPERARALRDEGKMALAWIKDRITSEQIDCDFKRNGRFHAAHTPRAYDALVRDADQLRRDDGIEAHAVPRKDQMAEIGTESYHGGLVFPDHAAVDPACYHRGLLAAAIAAGVQVVENCPALGIEPQTKGFSVRTRQGTIRTNDIIVATNGYTGQATPWWQRRVIPIGSYIIATEPLPKDLVDDLFPTDRIASDTRKVVYYYRLSPDRTRVVFGGRVSASETDPKISGPKLYYELCRIFPQVRGYRISHSWMGTVAYTFDELAHTGVHEGIHYAMGYCGSGVSMASYLGMRAGNKVLGLPEGRTAFDALPFPTRPLYSGNPWFLPPMVAWYRWRDRMQYQKAQQIG